MLLYGPFNSTGFFHILYISYAETRVWPLFCVNSKLTYYPLPHPLTSHLKKALLVHSLKTGDLIMVQQPGYSCILQEILYIDIRNPKGSESPKYPKSEKSTL